MGNEAAPDKTIDSAGAGAAGLTGRRTVTALAVAAAAAFAALLGVRTLTTPDLGYHLAYGDHFLDTGSIVDGELGIYSTAAPADRDGLGLGPGCWYDAEGRYRFPNANWLSQVVMAAVHRWVGLEGLSVLLAVLVAGIFALAIATMRRLGLGWTWVAAGLLMTAMVAYERFLLRPEVFGYLVVMGQWWVLSGVAGGERSRGASPAAKRGEERSCPALGWRPVAALVALQWLLVNLHSYFLLGIGLTGAVLAEHLLRRAWHRLRRPSGGEDAAAGGRNAVRLGIVLLGQVGVCFLNPWTWRLAVLPFQTLAFMQKHNIAGSQDPITGHPWAIIGEFFRPFAPVFAHSKATYAYCVLLALAAAGLAAAAIRRRWAHVLIIAAMTGVSLFMRRNIAPAALLIAPTALAACRELLAAAGRRFRVAARSHLAMAAAAALALAGACGCLSVLTQRFYRDERLSVRFGLGPTRSVFPIGAAEWINENRPTGRLWTDYDSSSNLHYFTRPRRPVPILTNTWAYPPRVMRQVLDQAIGRRAFLRQSDCQVVVLQVMPKIHPAYVPLGRRLAGDPNWAMVYLGAAHAVFLRADGENAELARRRAITPRSLDLGIEEFVGELRRLDPLSSHAAYLGGYTLGNLGWYTQAVAVFREVLPEDPYPHRVWNQIGWCLRQRGTIRMFHLPRDYRGKQDWQEARRCFLRALRLKGDYEDARTNLRLIEEQIAAEKVGRLYPPW